MKQICIDREKCVGCGRCLDFAPSIFTMQDGFATVRAQPRKDELQVAENALENCPEDAIYFEGSE